MKKRPVIGIIASWKKSEGIIPIYRTGVHYIEQVEEAGGLPIQIPLSDKWNSDEIDNYISICDGFLFPGGGDFDPSLYGEEALDGIDLDNNDVTIERYSCHIAKISTICLFNFTTFNFFYIF